MKSQRITNASIFYAFTSALLLAGAVGIRFVRPVNTIVNDPTLNSLTSQASDLAEFDELALSRSTETYNAAQERLWNDERVTLFMSDAAAAGWRLQAIGSSDSVFTTNRRYLLRRTDLSFANWPNVSRFLKESARSAGFTIEALSIEATPGEKRSFSILQAVVSLPEKKPSAEKPNNP